jgi:hypothetical protein
MQAARSSQMLVSSYINTRLLLLLQALQLQFFEGFGLLNIQFPILTILDAVSPILYFQFFYVIPYVILPSILWSP